MILDIPELLLKVATHADWRAVLALQRLNRGAYRDRPVLVQEELWRCAVRSRWPWSVYVEPEGFLDERELIAACSSWRRAYAYLRTVGFVATPSLPLTLGGWMIRSRRRYECRGRRPTILVILSARQTRHCRGSRNVPGRKSRWSKRDASILHLPRAR